MSKRVLIVDDDQYLLQTLTRLLVRAGHQVVSCSQFEAARTFLSDETPDVVIADVRLGAFNGLQIIAFLKQEHPEVTAIVLTGYDDPVIADQAARIGATYLVKPVSAELLLDRINLSTS